MLQVVAQVPGPPESDPGFVVNPLLLALVVGILTLVLGYRLLRSDVVPPGIRARFGMLDESAERRRRGK